MSNREYPERPLVGVGGVVIAEGRVLLVRRGTEPLLGQWSIPGGLLETGETLHAGVERELHEETGLTVRVIELIEALERIFPEGSADGAAVNGLNQVRSAIDTPGRAAAQIAELGAEMRAGGAPARPRYHYVILDYLCERVGGDARPGSDVTEVAFVSESDLLCSSLSELSLRVLAKAFAMHRSRCGAKPASKEAT